MPSRCLLEITHAGACRQWHAVNGVPSCLDIGRFLGALDFRSVVGYTANRTTREWRSGSAIASQAMGRGFESRLPLHPAPGQAWSRLLGTAEALVGRPRAVGAARMLACRHQRGFLHDEGQSARATGNLARRAVSACGTDRSARSCQPGTAERESLQGWLVRRMRAIASAAVAPGQAVRVRGRGGARRESRAPGPEGDSVAQEAVCPGDRPLPIQSSPSCCFIANRAAARAGWHKL